MEDRVQIAGIETEKSIELKAIDDGYVYFVKLLITQNFLYLVKAFDDKIDDKYINYKFKLYQFKYKNKVIDNSINNINREKTGIRR